MPKTFSSSFSLSPRIYTWVACSQAIGLIPDTFDRCTTSYRGNTLDEIPVNSNAFHRLTFSMVKAYHFPPESGI